VLSGDRCPIRAMSAFHSSTFMMNVGSGAGVGPSLVVNIQQTRVGTMVVKIARIAAWLLVVAIVVMTLGPPTVRPVSGFNRSLEHVAAFALLGLAFGLAYPNRRALLTLIGVAVVALMETLQQIVPGRHAYFSDFIINAGGVCAGVVLAILFGWFRRGIAAVAKARQNGA
jgi:VanZ family protein